MHLPFLIKQTPETLTTFRKLVELDLIVLSFIQNYDFLKYYAFQLILRIFLRTFQAEIAKK